MAIFITGDWHDGHEMILRYCSRPFRTTRQMSKAIQTKHNEVVGPDDTVYNLGDFTLEPADSVRKYERYLRGFNGQHHLILGNHDRWNAFRYLDAGFLSVHTSLELDYHPIPHVHLVHDPSMFCLLPTGSLLLHGHVHTLYKHVYRDGKHAINVGVDVWDYKPISMEDILMEILEDTDEEKRESVSHIIDFEVGEIATEDAQEES